VRSRNGTRGDRMPTLRLSVETPMSVRADRSAPARAIRAGLRTAQGHWKSIAIESSWGSLCGMSSRA